MLRSFSALFATLRQPHGASPPTPPLSAWERKERRNFERAEKKIGKQSAKGPIGHKMVPDNQDCLTYFICLC